MNGVIGPAQLLLDSELGPDQLDLAEMIYTSGRNLLAIVNEVLDFSMLEQKVFELNVLSISLIVSLFPLSYDNILASLCL